MLSNNNLNYSNQNNPLGLEAMSLHDSLTIIARLLFTVIARLLFTVIARLLFTVIARLLFTVIASRRRGNQRRGSVATRHSSDEAVRRAIV